MAKTLIAVLDDEQTVCVAMRRLIRSAGLDAETYSSGEEFLQAVQSHRFDCVLLDLHMPYMNGHEVLSRLSRLPTRIPAIVITGHDTPEARERALAAGAAAYLLKPVDESRLLNAIATATSTSAQKSA
jgi:FixJ family two-component response regulator